MELINKDTPQVKEFISSLDSMLNGIESIVKHYKPHLNGERFLSNNEVSKKLCQPANLARVARYGANPLYPDKR